MKNCWDVLGVTPTSDVESIKSAWRALIKTWHPDLVKDSKREEEYTAKCAEINDAYADAIRLAGIRARVERQTHHERNRMSRRSHQGSDAIRLRLYTWIAAVFILLVILSRIVSPRYLIPAISGFCVMGALNSILYAVLVRLTNWNEKTVWTVLFLVNILVVQLLAADPLFTIGAFLALPLWLLFKWFKHSQEEVT